MGAVPIGWLTASIDVPAAVFDSASAFWLAVTGSTRSPARGERGGFATLLPEHGDAYLRVQRTRNATARCHLGVHVDDVAVEAERAVRLGAAVLEVRRSSAVLSSPGGLVFRVVARRAEVERPPPLRWPNGHRSLVDQLAVDAPPTHFDSEAAFWAGFTGWKRRRGSRPELEPLARPPGMPLRLLLQRLDDPAIAATRAHLDLACSDVGAERRRHESLGATVVRVTGDWTTLRDPAGLAYCITRRDPDTGTL